MEKTSIEWLAEQLLTKYRLKIDNYQEFKQAKEMEKQQIINACDYGKKYHETFDYSAEQYYNETFNK
jgi:hypothetical protein